MRNAPTKKAKRQGKKASLVQQFRPNLFTTDVANIGPGEEIEIVIRYQEALRYDAGRFSLRFPMAITPRFTPSGSAGHPSTHGFSFSDPLPSVQNTTGANSTTLEVRLDAGFPISELDSPYHQTVVTREGGISTVSLDGPVPGDRDFVLSWTPKGGAKPKAAFFSQVVKDEVYAMIMMLPPETSTKLDVLKETIFIVDTSGSMEGHSIVQAKKALIDALPRLGNQDRFNLVQFSDSASALFEHQSQLVSRDNLDQAETWIEGLTANGGTDMLRALHKVLPTPIPAGYVRQIVFITDGAVGNEAMLFSYIQEHLGKARLFTVGIGSAPNAHFMRNAAQFGRGTFTFIGRPDEVAEKMGQLFAKLARPALTDIVVDWGHREVEAWPRQIPDLYVGEPIVVTAKLPRAVQRIEAKGRRGPDQYLEQFSVSAEALDRGIAKLWAREKIKSLNDSRITGTPEGQVQEQILQVALRHHLVSRYTSLVAVDKTPSRPEGTDLLQQEIAGAHPMGHGSLPQGGTASSLLLLLGAVLTSLGVLGRRRGT